MPPPYPPPPRDGCRRTTRPRNTSLRWSARRSAPSKSPRSWSKCKCRRDIPPPRDGCRRTTRPRKPILRGRRGGLLRPIHPEVGRSVKAVEIHHRREMAAVGRRGHGSPIWRGRRGGLQPPIHPEVRGSVNAAKFTTAARWLPSDDEATDRQYALVGAPVCSVQFTPKLVEV